MAEEKSIRVISFTGLAADWRTWKFKFLAKATALGYRGVLLGTVVAPDDELEVDADDVGGEELLEARRANVADGVLRLGTRMRMRSPRPSGRIGYGGIAQRKHASSLAKSLP